MKHIPRRLLFLLIVVSVAGLVLVYPPMRLAGWLFPAYTPGPGIAMLLFLVPFGVRALHERTNHAWSRAATAVIMTWLGVCFLMLCLLLPAEVANLAGVSDAQTLGQVVLGLTAALTLYGFYNAQRLHVEVVDLNAPAAIRGQRLVQISDVHIGSRQPGLLRPIVERINALQPDYALITGDLIDMHGISEADLEPLGRIEAPTLFSIGNHERYVDLEAICQRLENLGVEVLRNASVERNDFQFLGIDDAESKSQVEREIGKLTAASNAYRVLLYHRPDGADAAAKWGANLMLTGHTHRGQIFPFNFLVERVFPELFQMYNYENMKLYVSPGTGTWGPVLRLGSKCEITLFRLL